MKKFITDIRTLAALLMASATIAACSGSDDSIVSEPQHQAATTKTCTLTVKASKGSDATTRALTLDESGTKNVLNATWTEGDKVTVYYMHEQDMGVSIPTEIGTLTAQSSGASTTLTGEITTTGITIRGMFGGSSETHDLTADDKLYLSYSGTKGEGGKVDDAEQDGTLQTLADYFDSAGAELTVSSISGSTVNTTEGTADFENNSFIIRFTLKDKATDNAINPSSLVLNYTTTGEYPLEGTQEITIPNAAYTTNGNGVVFVQLEPTNQTTGFSGNITLTATVGTDTYTYEKSGVTFTNGQYYEITVKMTPTYPVALNAVTTSYYVGSVITSDGIVYAKASDATAAGKTAVAIIAYVGSAGSVDDSSDSSRSYKGLAIAMSDAAQEIPWSEVGYGSYVSCSDDLATALGYKNGIACTNTLSNDDGHTAASAAASNNSTDAPTGTSGWFLPSMGQWNLILQGLATKKQGTAVTTNIPYGDTFDTFDTYTATNLNSVITAAGGTGFGEYYDYWSSTQYGEEEAWYVQLGLGSAWMEWLDYNCYVRSALAF